MLPDGSFDDEGAEGPSKTKEKKDSKRPKKPIKKALQEALLK